MRKDEWLTNRILKVEGYSPTDSAVKLRERVYDISVGYLSNYNGRISLRLTNLEVLNINLELMNVVREAFGGKNE